MLNGRPYPLGVSAHDLDGACAFQGFDVAACGKHLIAAGEHNGAHRLIARQFGKGLR